MSEPLPSTDELVPEDRLLSVAEVARLLNVSESMVRKMAKANHLPGVLPKIGGLWRVHERTLRDWLRANAARPDDTPDVPQTTPRQPA